MNKKHCPLINDWCVKDDCTWFNKRGNECLIVTGLYLLDALIYYVYEDKMRTEVKDDN